MKDKKQLIKSLVVCVLWLITGIWSMIPSYTLSLYLFSNHKMHIMEVNFFKVRSI